MHAHESARAALESWLSAQHLAPGARVPPARELGRRLGLSHALANRAAITLVAAGRLRREGNRLFVAAPAGEVVPLLVHTAVPHAARLQLAHSARYPVRVEAGLVDPSAFAAALRRAVDDGIAGVVFWPRLPPRNVLEWLHGRGIEYVVAGDLVTNVDSVAFDGQRGAIRAVEHVFAAGHREIAFVTTAPADSALRRERLQGFAVACLASGSRSSSQRVIDIGDGPDPALVDAALTRLQAEGVSAVVTLADRHARALVVAAHGRRLRVPRDLSIISLQDHPTLPATDPPLGSVTTDDAQLCHVALALLQRRLPGRTRLPTPTVHLRLTGTVAPRGSVATRPVSAAPATRGPPAPPRWLPLSIATLTHDVAERRAAVAAWNDRRWPSPTDTWVPLPLRRIANRGRLRHHALFGQHPLPAPAPGRHTIHGVVFTLPDETRSQPRSCTVLAPGRFLRWSLACHGTWRRIVFLHALGNATPGPAATYTLVDAAGGRHVVTVVAAGPQTPAPPDANAQDWWPDHPQAHFASGLSYCAAPEGDPLLGERYLYTLEWRNPEQAIPIERCEAALLPDSRCSLATLAISAEPA